MSASLTMLNRYGHRFNEKAAVIDLLQSMPLGFYKEVLILKGHCLTSKEIPDERLPKAWGNAIDKIMSSIDDEADVVSEIQEMTSSGSLGSRMRNDYPIMSAGYRRKTKKLRAIVVLAIQYQEQVSE